LLIVLVAAFFFMYVGAEISINGWLFTYSRQMDLTTEISGAYLTSVFWIFITLGRLVAIPLYSYVRSTTILVVDLVGWLTCGELGMFARFTRKMLAHYKTRFTSIQKKDA
jgi:fucose permease